MTWCASPDEGGRQEAVEASALAGDSLESDGSANPEQCFWAGTAPFCDGQCPVGFAALAMDKCGDGDCCLTGWKVFCCPA
jgi:hypothetical protein